MPEIVQFALIVVGGIVAIRSRAVQMSRDTTEACKQRAEELTAKVARLMKRVEQLERYNQDLLDLLADERDGRARDAATQRVVVLRLRREVEAAYAQSPPAASSRRSRHTRGRRGHASRASSRPSAA